VLELYSCLIFSFNVLFLIVAINLVIYVICIYSLLYSYLLLLKTADVLTVIVSQLPVPMCKVK